MRIGIVTLPFNTNYGGILQAYALQSVLEQLGHEVCLIERRARPTRLPVWKMPYSYGKRIIKNITGHPYPIFYEQKKDRETPIVRQNTDVFIDKYLNLIKVKEFSDLQEKDFDAIVVGSDQVWRPQYFNDRIENAYLEFAENWHIKRIAYAASFGTEEWEYTLKQTENCKCLIKKFEAVSVRESSGVDLCKKYFDVDANWVLDPTMLLEKDDYINIFRKANTPQHNGTLLCYILDDGAETTTLTKKIEQEYNLKAFNVKCKTDDITAPVEDRIQPPLEQWIRGFYDAKFVITDSFHACVFSILFHKPFLTLGNKGRGMARFKSLLSMFGLEDRIVDVHSPININTNIDWNVVDKLLEMKRGEAIKFLTNNLVTSYGE